MYVMVNVYTDKPVRVMWSGYERVFTKNDQYPAWPHSLCVQCPENSFIVEEVLDE